MKQKLDSEIFIAYIKMKSKILGAFIAFHIILYVVLYLYHVPMEAAGYASILCMFLGSILLFVDFIHYKKKCKDLVWIYENIDILLEKLPKAEDLMEYYYQEMLKKIEIEKMQFISKADEEKTDLLDYYTLWVHQIKTPIAAMHLLLETEDLPRVCEKGFTSYNGRNDKKSTGIGLYLCKQILDKMSHTIKIESEVGKGTKVKIGLKNAKVETRFE